MRDLAVRLQPGGRVEIATDHVGYADWIDEVLSAEPLLENVHAPQPFLREVPGRMRTAYELEWRAKGGRSLLDLPTAVISTTAPGRKRAPGGE